jgi:intein/homing endonuclease
MRAYKLAVITTEQVMARPEATYGETRPEVLNPPVGGHTVCLHPNTWVYTLQGLSKIKDVHNPTPLVTTEGMGICVGRITSRPTESIMINEELWCSLNHRLFKYENGEVVLCRAGEVKVGDWLLIPMSIQFEGQDVPLPEIDVERVYRVKNSEYVKKKLKEKGIILKRRESVQRLGLTPRHLRRILNQKYPTTQHVIAAIEQFIGEKIDVEEIETNMHRKVKIPTCLTEDLAQAFGYWLGDGDTGMCRNRIDIREERKDVAEFYSDLFYRIFNIKPKIYTYKSFYELNFANKYVATLLKWLLQNLSLISQAKQNVIVGFLKGLFDAEGFVSGSEVYLSSKDRDLLLFVKMLLLRCGIVSQLEKQRGGYVNGLYYRLKLCTKHIEKFVHNIGFRAVDKQRQITLDTKRRWMNIKPLSEQIGIRRVSKLQRLKTTEEFIDIMVKPTEHFIANGYVVHNSHAVSHRVYLHKPAGATSKRLATLVASNYLPRETVELQITKAGIEDVPKEEEKKK